MSPPFDDTRLDDPRALGAADPALRELAERGARVRREAAEAASSAADAVSVASGEATPRAVVAAGPDSRLLRAVLEPWCPVPFVAWPGPGLPGWVGSLDLVVVLAPDGDETESAADSASAVAEAVRRGCSLLVACPQGSLVAQHALGRHSRVLPSTTGDQLATAVVVLDVLHRLGLGPEASAEDVAGALDDVALANAPGRDIAVNPSKMLALAFADATPLLWGGSVLAARAGRRIAEALRRASGRTALAADAQHLLPVLEASAPRDLFADPFADAGPTERDPRPVLVILDDVGTDSSGTMARSRLLESAARHDVRVETVDERSAASGVARYAALLATGSYAATYLAVGLDQPVTGQG